MLVLLGTSLQGVLRGLQDPSRGGVCICHLCLGPVSWRLTQISPLGQCRAPPQDFAAADNRLVWQSVQTLKAKQPWQLSTRTNILLRDTRPYTAQGWECARVCVYVQDQFLHRRVREQRLLWHSLSRALVKRPGISRQYSGLQTQRQERFGASAKVSSCRGAVTQEKSKTPTWLAGFPLSWETDSVTWPTFTSFKETHCGRWRSCLLLCNMEQ